MTEPSTRPDQAALDELVAQSDTGARHPAGLPGRILLWIAIAWSLFQLWYASPLPFMLNLFVLNDTEARAIHLAFGMFLAFTAYPAFKASPRSYIPTIDWILALAGAQAHAVGGALDATVGKSGVAPVIETINDQNLAFARAADGKYIVVRNTADSVVVMRRAANGDTDAAVYRAIVGRHVRLPLLGRELPVIADDFVDPEYGSGAVKVTPGHDPADFECGHRHGLPAINLLHPDGRLNANAGPYEGVSAEDARERVIVESLTAIKRAGALEGRSTREVVDTTLARLLRPANRRTTSKAAQRKG